MPRDVGAYLEDIVAACNRIDGLSRGTTIEDYRSNDMLRWAIERQCSILGEALYQLRAHFPDIADQIPESRRIINFRHVLIHGYAQIEDDVVWGIVDSKLKSLREHASKLLGE